MLPKAPLQSTSIASRCICCQCGETPELKLSGTDPVTIEARCCGDFERRVVAKSALIHMQRFFSDDEVDTEPLTGDDRVNLNPRRT
jgi:hypothetical protein